MPPSLSHTHTPICRPPPPSYQAAIPDGAGVQCCSMSHSDSLADDCGLGCTCSCADGCTVLGDVHNHIILDVGLVTNHNGIDVTCLVKWLCVGGGAEGGARGVSLCCCGVGRQGGILCAVEPTGGRSVQWGVARPHCVQRPDRQKGDKRHTYNAAHTLTLFASLYLTPHTPLTHLSRLRHTKWTRGCPV